MDNRNNQILFSPTQKAVPAVADLSSFYRAFQDGDYEQNASSGKNTLTLSEVPSGIIRIVTVITAANLGSVTDHIDVVGNIGTKMRRIANKVNPSTEELIEFYGQLILDKNDYIYVDFYGCSAGDSIVLAVMGYDVKKY